VIWFKDYTDFAVAAEGIGGVNSVHNNKREWGFRWYCWC